MFAALGRFSFRYRWPVLIAFLVIFPLAAVIGGGAFAALSPGGFDDPTAESIEAREQLADRLDDGGADVIALLHRPRRRDRHSRGAEAPPRRSTAPRRTLGGARHVPTNTGAPSSARRHAFAVVSLRGDDGEKRTRRAAGAAARSRWLAVQFGGISRLAPRSVTPSSGSQRAELIASRSRRSCWC
jgi:RND superfamily putative drug exporter